MWGGGGGVGGLGVGKNEKGQKKHKQKQTSRAPGPLSAPFLLSAPDAPTGFRLFLSPGQGRPAVKKKIKGNSPFVQ